MIMVNFPCFILDEDKKLKENLEENKISNHNKHLINEFLLVSSSLVSSPLKQESGEEINKTHSLYTDKKENRCKGLCLYSDSCLKT